MFIARWRIEARFGHKQEAVALFNRWQREIGTKIGWTPEKSRLVTGSVGALESTLENEVRVETLAELDESFARLAKIPQHAQWGKELEPHVVSGTSRWEIFRVL